MRGNKSRSYFSLVFSTFVDILLHRELSADPQHPLSGAEHLDEEDQRGCESKAMQRLWYLQSFMFLRRSGGLPTSFRLEKLCCVMMLHELLKFAVCTSILSKL